MLQHLQKQQESSSITVISPVAQDVTDTHLSGKRGVLVLTSDTTKMQPHTNGGEWKAHTCRILFRKAYREDE